jgi:hypothetical protein
MKKNITSEMSAVVPYKKSPQELAMMALPEKSNRDGISSCCFFWKRTE